MINIEQSVVNRMPWLDAQPKLVTQPAFGLLRKLVHEEEINAFLAEHQALKNFSFIDKVFDYFNFSYSLSAKSRANIPAEGRVVIVANHPVGSLDGLALLRAVGEIRRDVKIVANDLLTSFTQIEDLLLPLDNLGRASFRKSYKAVVQALEAECAVIVFPAGEVSRASPLGIRDGRWQTGFLHFIRKTKASLLPVHIEAKNSALFYSLSMLYKPLSTLWLAREMFNKNHTDIHFTVGDPISVRVLDSVQVADRHLAQRIKKYLYKMGRGKSKGFVTEKTIAHPEPATEVKRQLEQAQRLGNTRDDKAIYLCDYEEDSPLMRELGRLREKTFRKVGEGTGSRRDLDGYDRVYQHLVLWDNTRYTIAGAYRLGNCKTIMQTQGLHGLYTSELFNYQPAALPLLAQAVELGRSFVAPDYWGKNSLDYLWQGLGALLQHRPDVRYLVGPVSMSADIEKPLRDRLVHHYQSFHASPQTLAISKAPFVLEPHIQEALDLEMGECDRETSFRRLQAAFASANCKMPVLFKQYAALFEEGGFTLMDFGVDREFGHCVDGLFIADLTRLKAAKRKRYLGGQ
ncbi:lysophospholipid acyltransferase family protein [Simiduia sp. 21SJ11W-1]|uniref:lysophospholipid acyltransferase family protein n=1 Tax=Simiduia sp. 21SJ11W-1 TaxID=2909669 RepID=UPI00209CE806|nr:GNAT family N-acyltransferase [Simiduia sp. 21SJ11W-1]UTA46660.1 lysophospholipid acyltransferase family protein [Simiduia sp. 21SJ11W-1]